MISFLLRQLVAATPTPGQPEKVHVGQGKIKPVERIATTPDSTPKRVGTPVAIKGNAISQDVETCHHAKKAFSRLSFSSQSSLTTHDARLGRNRNFWHM
ncbi:AAEL002570-PA [Aedes aegypti]|uniref:AAEL002570-PA n=1 Tax=Aedes aegypti TaxID=7159 RepID=Q17HT3_AEDAE|nr:AAEL002570-PA [Aedes aegypti]